MSQVEEEEEGGCCVSLLMRWAVEEHRERDKTQPNRLIRETFARSDDRCVGVFSCKIIINDAPRLSLTVKKIQLSDSGGERPDKDATS